MSKMSEKRGAKITLLLRATCRKVKLLKSNWFLLMLLNPSVQWYTAIATLRCNKKLLKWVVPVIPIPGYIQHIKIK